MRSVAFLTICITTIFLLAPLKPVSSAREMHQPAPEVSGKHWLNSEATTLSAQCGKVVLLEFWTYGCYNCRNVEPYIKKWYAKYHKKGLQIFAVHSPEFKHEFKIENVRQYIKNNDIHYPVVTDNDFSIWKSFRNHYWPSIYLIDKQGVIRYHHIGEGAYQVTEAKIAELLAEPATE